MASTPKVGNEIISYFSTMPEVSPSQEKEALRYQSPNVTPITPQTRKRSVWWSSLSPTTRSVAISTVVTLTAAIIGIVVGVLVHNKVNRSPTLVPSPSPSTPTSVSSLGPSTPTPTSVCRGTLCPSMLAFVEDSTPSAPSGSNLFFALGQDKQIWYRRGDGVTWFSNWTNLSGVDVLSQPDALNLDGNQTNIWVVDSNIRMQTLAYKNGVWDSNWIDLGGNFTTPMTSCSRELGVLDIFGRASDGTVQHMNWSQSQGYSDRQSLGGFCASALYGGYQSPFGFDINVWNGLQWTNWQGKTSIMKGDPFAISFGPDRSDYFGIGEDGAMYYTTWTTSAGYGPLIYLGGLFESTPFAITNGNSRVDVLAVGTDDRLKHKALIGLSWSPDWDDLGGSFNSAPVAIYTPSGLVSVFGIANNGSVFHGTWTVGSGASWTNGNNWTVDGGVMSTTWFRRAIS